MGGGERVSEVGLLCLDSVRKRGGNAVPGAEGAADGHGLAKWLHVH